MEHSVINAVGVWFFSVNTQRHLYLMRDDTKHKHAWGLPGGKCEPGETLLDAVRRECKEEIGSWPDVIKIIPIEKFTSNDDAFVYHTFFCPVYEEFRPTLNEEHLGYAWIDGSTWPRPMHPGLWNTVNFDVIKHKIEVIRSSLQISQ